MVGQDFYDKLSAIIQDLQTKGKGQTINIMFRNPDNTPNVMPLSSDINGVVNTAQWSAVETFINTLVPTANQYAQTYGPVQTALDAFKTAQAPHEAAITAATNARKALNDALMADTAYQNAKASLDAARANVDYIAARDAYVSKNVSENFAELSNVKGAYVV